MRARVQTLVLLTGMVAGAAMAAAGLVGRSGPEGDLPEGVVARVGDAQVLAQDYQRALNAVAAERRGPLGAAEARHVLDRLVDEELLVQRGVELGLAERDPRLRAELSAAVIGLIVARAEVEAAEPTEAVLRAFYEANAGAFREGDLFLVERVRVVSGPPDGPGERRAEGLAARLGAGEELAAVARDADPSAVELPDGWLTADTLLEYLGPTVVAAVVGLDEGGVAGPIRASGGFEVVRLAERRPGRERPFEEVEPEVREAYRRQAGEVGLRAFLDARRREVPVVIAHGLGAEP